MSIPLHGTNFDIIGDIHGHADALERVLPKLGSARKFDVYYLKGNILYQKWNSAGIQNPEFPYIIVNYILDEKHQATGAKSIWLHSTPAQQSNG